MTGTVVCATARTLVNYGKPMTLWMRCYPLDQMEAQLRVREGMGTGTYLKEVRSIARTLNVSIGNGVNVGNGETQLRHPPIVAKLM